MPINKATHLRPTTTPATGTDPGTIPKEDAEAEEVVADPTEVKADPTAVEGKSRGPGAQAPKQARR